MQNIKEPGVSVDLGDNTLVQCLLMGLRRYGGCMIDLVTRIIFMGGLFIVSFLIGVTLEGPVLFMCFFGVLTILGFVYEPFFQSSKWQATIGQRIMGIMITDTNGRKVSFLRALARFWIRNILITLTFGLAWVPYFFTKRKQTLYDLVTRTVVVRREIISSDGVPQ
jgi:uncharacterized RDD family membrane protein YckC